MFFLLPPVVPHPLDPVHPAGRPSAVPVFGEGALVQRTQEGQGGDRSQPQRVQEVTQLLDLFGDLGGEVGLLAGISSDVEEASSVSLFRRREARSLLKFINL